MYQPLSLFIGLRYTRAKQRNQFISFVSLISLLGMILGVTALVVVMSVMNGFEAELRNRILSVVPHGYIDGPEQRLSDWPRWQQQLSESDTVVAAAPYIDGTVMLSRPGMVRGAVLHAIEPESESQVSTMGASMVAGQLQDLQQGQYRIVLGEILARYLGVYLGDEISVILPRVTVTPVGVFPESNALPCRVSFRWVPSLIAPRYLFIWPMVKNCFKWVLMLKACACNYPIYF
ncbi:ABC transporter permease [Oceanicoccus sagamiensis]|uniref:ABC transporter permease n=1 Tax=Oceanicoccus sagamiensis TaxID=716816 RepID=UPI001F0A26FE|nr:ABC transporter permease [Oceanicoccus sagamiensis]